MIRGMGIGFAPVGKALPPRRDQIISAADTPSLSRNNYGDSINVSMARDRMLEFFERDQLPGDVRATLASALNGDLTYQSRLFSAMLDTWPKLQKNIAEVARLVSCAPWKVIPYAERGENPDRKSEKLAKEVEAIVWGMKPRTARRELGMEGTIKSLVLAYYYGHGANEIRWEKDAGGWKLRCTKAISARYFGYPYDDRNDDPEDRFMFDPNGSQGVRTFEDFPENRFLVAINVGHAGHPSMAAPLRALAGYWLAAVYGLKWFMNFTQLYGIPWRHVKTDDDSAGRVADNAMRTLGSEGWIRTKSGVDIDILSPASTAGASLPQRELIALADTQCDQFILGQTLTGGTDGSGSRALGEVHENTRDGVVDGVADFVGEILTHQLIPAVVSVNWGESVTEFPEMWAKREVTKDEKGAAERMEILMRMKLPMAESYVYEDLGVPVPAAKDKLFQPPADDTQGDPALGGSGFPPSETKPGGGKPIEARYNPGQERDPAGSSTGGRWTSTGRGQGQGKGESATRGEMRPGTDEDRKRLKVPPAYTDLIVSDDPDSDLLGLATKPDGEQWPAYSEEYHSRQQDAKWGRVAELEAEFDDLAAQMDKDISAGGTDAGPAAALRLIRQTGMRNGGEGKSMVYVMGPDGEKVIGPNGKPVKTPITTYGSSSLRGTHVAVDGDKITMDFPGKKGVQQHIEITDKVLADVMRPNAGKDVKVFNSTDAKTLKYLGKISGDKYKVHDFRTLHATLTAESEVSALVKAGKLPQNQKELDALKKAVAGPVSEILGNTPSVALENYIHPDVFRALELP